MDFARELVTLLVNAVWQIAATALIGSAGGRTLRRAPGRLQHRYWIAVLCVSVLLPFASAVVPRLASLLMAPEPAGPPWQGDGVPGGTLRIDGSRFGGDMPASWIGNQPKSWLVLLILGVYSAFLLCSAVRLLRSSRKLDRFLQSAKRADLSPRLVEIARGCQERLRVRTVSIVVSPLARSIFAAGDRSPTIVLPERIAESISDHELQVALSHEMAHIYRRDFFWNTIFQLITLPFAFHPATRWMQRKIVQTREMASDELAAQTLDSSRYYCRGLITLAERMHAASAGPALGIFDGNQLEGRIMQLVNQSRPSRRAIRLAIAASAAALFAVSVVCTAFAFQAKPGTQGQEFVGTWKAEFEGQTYWIVRISSVNPPITGTFSTAENVRIGDDGTVEAVEGIEGLNRSSQMLDPKLDGNRLTFKWRDGDDVTTLRMTLTGPDTATLMLLTMPDEEDQARLSKFKGFPLKRAKTASE